MPFRLILFLNLTLATTYLATAAAVITSVVETGGDGTVTAKWTGNSFTGIAPLGAYTVPPYGVLAKCFVDRIHAHTNASGTVAMPSYLVGNEYIMTRNDNRENTAFKLDITVSRDVLVYLLIDNRIGDTAANGGNPPFNATDVTAWTGMTWVGAAGFRPVLGNQNHTANAAFPDEVGIDENADGTINNWYSIYTNRYPTGTFTLNQQGLAGNNMYSVVIQGVGPTGPPAAPAGVTAVSGDGQVMLNWNAANGATRYFVKRSATSGSAYVTVGTATGTTLQDLGLANDVDYFYVVTASNVFGESTNSLEVVAHPNPVVTGFSAVGGTNKVQLNWTTLAGATSYSVLRSASAAGPFISIASGVTTLNYVDTTAAAGGTFYYRVTAALSGGGSSGQSATVSALTAPGAPTLTATLFAGTVIRVGWNAVPGASQYLLERSTDGVNFSTLVAQTQASYTNVGLTASNTYYYRVQATNTTGLSGYSNVSSNMTPVFGINVNFAQGFVPIPPMPPGYLQDTGGVYGAQTGGFNYGWDRNIGVDGRYRATTIAADLRYDTFMHLMKLLPSAIWEIELPNGPYVVRIASIDTSGAVDATYQFNVEGVTTTAIPAVASQAAEFIVTCAVTDGKLTVTSGPSAANNKIAFIDIYADTPLPPVIGAQPQSQTLEQGRPVSLSVSFSQGSSPLIHQWYFNGNLLADATNRTLTFAHVQPGNQGSYYLITTNYGGAATSSVATITVTPDTTLPFIISAGSVDGNTIGICFNEELNTIAPNAHDPSNYGLNGGANTVTNVIVSLDGRSVLLQYEGTVSNGYTVAAFSMPDYAGNLGDSTTNGLILGFAAQDIGGPLRAGSNFTCDNQSIDIIGGGVDYWGTADQAYLVTTNVAGDFDARVRVTSLRGSNAITKALLIARETTNSDSAGVHVSVNPPPGRNQFEMGLRAIPAGVTATVGTNFTPANIPNAWMRLTRVGNLFTGYRSSNGVDWVQLGQTNQVLAGALAVGFGVTAHDTNLWATGTFRSFSVGTPIAGGALTISAPKFANGVFSAAFTGAPGFTYEVQYSHTVAISKPCIDFNGCPEPPVLEPWFTLTNIVGDGVLKTFTDPTPAVDRRFYRILRR